MPIFIKLVFTLSNFYFSFVCFFVAISIRLNFFVWFLHFASVAEDKFSLIKDGRSLRFHRDVLAMLKDMLGAEKFFELKIPRPTPHLISESFSDSVSIFPVLFHSLIQIVIVIILGSFWFIKVVHVCNSRFVFVIVYLRARHLRCMYIY